MSDTLQPSTPVRLYEQIIGSLQAFVRSSGMRIGDRLPAERDLAARLGVSRVSVKQALLILEVQGAIHTRHGGGSYLLRDGAEVMTPIAQLLERRERLPQALEARHALEVKLVQLAAARRTDADLAAMAAALEAMRAEIAVGALAEGPTRDFHDATYRAAHNDILLALMDQLAPHVSEMRHESLQEPGRPSRSLAEHTAIADAIAAGDAAAAMAAVESHLQTVADVRLLDWFPNGDNRPLLTAYTTAPRTPTA